MIGVPWITRRSVTQRLGSNGVSKLRSIGTADNDKAGTLEALREITISRGNVIFVFEKTCAHVMGLPRQ